MKKHLFLALTVIIVLAGCKKHNPDPSANFSTSHSNYYLQQQIFFTNSSTNGSSYAWDFGDGLTSTDQNPQHTYNTSGKYQVKLTVNGTAVATKNIKIYNGTASYEVDNYVTAPLQYVSFGTDASNNIINFYDHGVLAVNGRTDTIFTSNSNIYVGGYIGTHTFIVTPTYSINLYTHNTLVVQNTTQIIVSNAINKQGVLSLKTTKGNATIGQSLIQ